MDHDIDILHRTHDDLVTADIAVDHLYPWTLRSLEGSNVECAHLMILRKEMPAEIDAEKSGSAGDQVAQTHRAFEMLRVSQSLSRSRSQQCLLCSASRSVPLTNSSRITAGRLVSRKIVHPLRPRSKAL